MALDVVDAAPEAVATYVIRLRTGGAMKRHNAKCQIAHWRIAQTHREFGPELAVSSWVRVTVTANRGDLPEG